MFSNSYPEARDRFLRSARRAGATTRCEHHTTAVGPDGESLHLDAAWLGPVNAGRVLVVCSGTHGIEGYAGSAVQTAWLERFRGRLPQNTAVLLLHAINPWGFAHRMRVTEENVDLNRNFVDHMAPYPVNPGYAALHHALAVSEATETALETAFAALEQFRAAHGEQAYSDAVNGGQYSHPDGLFFGGHRAQWSNGAFRRLLRAATGEVRRAAIIDLHTGIGPNGNHVFLCFHAEDSPARARARAWWGERATNRDGVTHTAVARYSGLLVDAFTAELPQAETTAVVVEFGTRERREMQRAHIGANWLMRRRGRPDAAAAAVHSEFCEAFIPSAPEWREAVLHQGQEVIDKGISGIGSS